MSQAAQKIPESRQLDELSGDPEKGVAEISGEGRVPPPSPEIVPGIVEAALEVERFPVGPSDASGRSSVRTPSDFRVSIAGDEDAPGGSLPLPPEIPVVNVEDLPKAPPAAPAAPPLAPAASTPASFPTPSIQAALDRRIEEGGMSPVLRGALILGGAAACYLGVKWIFDRLDEERYEHE